MRPDLADYRCTDETYRLLWKWGSSRFMGMPRLQYPGKAAACGDYLPPRQKDEEGKPDLTEFDVLCAIIDNNLKRPKVEALKCKFRYKVNGRAMKKLEAARHLGVDIDSYLILLRSALRTVDLLMNGEEAA